LTEPIIRPDFIQDLTLLTIDFRSLLAVPVLGLGGGCDSRSIHGRYWSSAPGI
jgi:hypothetical protein